MIGDIRSLNLGNSSAIGRYEALLQNGFMRMELEGDLHRLISVSYTHLDVYKRQILKRAEKNENEKKFPVTYEISVESAGTALEEKLAGMLKESVDATLTQSGYDAAVSYTHLSAQG